MMEYELTLKKFSEICKVDIRTLETIKKEGLINYRIELMKTKHGKRNTRIINQKYFTYMAVYIYLTKFLTNDIETNKNFTQRKNINELFKSSFEKKNLDKIFDKLNRKSNENNHFLRRIEEYYSNNDYKKLREIIEEMNNYKKGSAQKVYIIDTNIFIKNPNILDKLDDRSRIIIPTAVLEELDGLKNNKKLKGNATLAIKGIQKHQENKLLEIREPNTSYIKKGFEGNKKDNQILSVALEENSKCENVILVTNDNGLGTKAAGDNLTTITLHDFINELSTTERQKYDIKLHNSLFNAIKNNSLEKLMKILEDKNVDINYINDIGETPLIFAIRNKHSSNEIIQALLNHPNLDIEKKDEAKLRMTPFIHAAQKNKIGIMKLLEEKGADIAAGSSGKNIGNTALLVSAWDGKFHIVKYLISTNKIPIDQSENNKYTALIKASIRGHFKIVEYLLKEGADKRIRDREGKTAVDYARERLHSRRSNLYKKIVEILEEE